MVLPDPVVCFAGRRFFSSSSATICTPRGSLVLVDWLTSGRHASGERWAFHHYSSRIDIRRAGRRVLYDMLLLDEADGPIGDRLGPFDVCLTAVVTGPLVADAAASIVRAIVRCGRRARTADFVVAAWTLPDGGALLRMTGASVEQVGAALRDRLSFLGRCSAMIPSAGNGDRLCISHRTKLTSWRCIRRDIWRRSGWREASA